MKQNQSLKLLETPVEVTIVRDGRPLMNQTFQHSPIRIGRVLENDIVLPFDSVSRFHCELHFENKKWSVVDLKSLNGLKVNGQQVTTASFDTSGEFEIKPVSIQFKPQTASAATAAMARQEKSLTTIVSPYDETLVGPDSRPPHEQAAGKRLHAEQDENAASSLAPDRPDQTPSSRRPVLNLEGRTLLTTIHPTVEKAKTKSVQVTVMWHDVVLSVDEFCNSEEMIIEINGIFLRLGRVGRDRASIRCPTGTNFLDRQGTESTLVPSAAASWESSDGIRIFARFVPQSKLNRTGLIPFLEDELIDPIVFSGAVHGAIAMAAVTMSKPGREAVAIQPERIARIIQAAPTPAPQVATQPTPTPTPVPTPTPQPIAKKPEPKPSPTPQPIVAKPTPAKKPVVEHKRKPPRPVVAVKPPRREEQPPPAAVITPPRPKASEAPIAKNPEPTPKPFQANSVGALKALSMLSAAPPPTGQKTETIVIRNSTSAGDTDRRANEVSTTKLLDQLPTTDSSSPAGSQEGLALKVSRSGAGYGTAGYSTKTGKRSVLGSIIGGAKFSETGKTDGLSREQVMKVVQKHHGQIQQCYERGLMEDANLAGRAEFEWEISAAGAVGSVSVKESNLRNGEKLLDCVKTVFRKMSFPAAKNGASTTPTIGLPFGRL